MILTSSVVAVTILAIGGTLAISGALDPADTSEPGVQQATISEPLAFSGGFRPGPCPANATEAMVGPVNQERGVSCNPSTVDMTDERLNGTVTWSENEDEYLGGIGSVTGEGFAVGYSGAIIENEDGAWRQVPVLNVSIDGFDGTTGNGEPRVFIGEGGYAGLIAVAQARPAGRFGGEEFTGYIVEAELPPVPEILVPQ